MDALLAQLQAAGAGPFATLAAVIECALFGECGHARRHAESGAVGAAAGGAGAGGAPRRWTLGGLLRAIAARPPLASDVLCDYGAIAAVDPSAAGQVACGGGGLPQPGMGGGGEAEGEGGPGGGPGTDAGGQSDGEGESSATTEDGEGTNGENTSDSPNGPPQLNIGDKQFGRKIGEHARDFGLDVTSATDRATLRTLAEEVTEHPDMVVQGPWHVSAGGGPDYWFFFKDSVPPWEDILVITKADGTFVTMFPNAANIRGFLSGAIP